MAPRRASPSTASTTTPTTAFVWFQFAWWSPSAPPRCAHRRRERRAMASMRLMARAAATTPTMRKSRWTTRQWRSSMCTESPRRHSTTNCQNLRSRLTAPAEPRRRQSQVNRPVRRAKAASYRRKHRQLNRNQPSARSTITSRRWSRPPTRPATRSPRPWRAPIKVCSLNYSAQFANSSTTATAGRWRRRASSSGSASCSSRWSSDAFYTLSWRKTIWINDSKTFCMYQHQTLQITQGQCSRILSNFFMFIYVFFVVFINNC